MDASLSPATPITTPSQQWAMIAGFFLPLIIAIINKKAWPKEFKTVIGFMAVVVSTSIQLGLEGKFDLQNFVPTMLTTFATSITSFVGVWKPSGVADAIETATDWGGETNGENTR